MATEIFTYKYRRKQCVQRLWQRTYLSRAVLSTLKIVDIDLIQSLFKEKVMFLMKEEGDVWKAAPEHQSIQGTRLKFEACESNRSEGME